MSPFHTDPPPDLPLRALLVFEAAARQLNMVRAAAHLGLTQGAVSRQIKALESQLGVPLFRRSPRGLALTEAGDVLADYVSRGLSELAAGYYRLGQPRRRTTLSVNASRTFALRALAPRIGNFVAQHPWINVRIDSHRYFANPDPAKVEVSIRFGRGDWQQGVEARLSEEAMFPVCAPSLLPAAGALDPLRFLRARTMLHFAERSYWAEWLTATKLPLDLAENGGPHFADTAMALAAAEAGQGVAIAHGIHVRDAIATGRLVRPFEASIGDGSGYWVVTTTAAASRSTVRAFVVWLKKEFGDGGGETHVSDA